VASLLRSSWSQNVHSTGQRTFTRMRLAILIFKLRKIIDLESQVIDRYVKLMPQHDEKFLKTAYIYACLVELNFRRSLLYFNFTRVQFLAQNCSAISIAEYFCCQNIDIWFSKFNFEYTCNHMFGDGLAPTFVFAVKTRAHPLRYFAKSQLVKCHLAKT